MNENELRDAIELPGELAGLALEPGLTEVMLREWRPPGALPLLSHTLLETWKRRSGRAHRDRLQRRRRSHGAIAQTAETVYRDSCPPSSRHRAQSSSA